MHAFIKTTVHQSRGIPSIKVTDLEKIDAPQYTASAQAMNKLTNPNSHDPLQHGMDFP